MQKNTEPDKIQMSMHQTALNIHNKILTEIAGAPAFLDSSPPVLVLCLQEEIGSRNYPELNAAGE